MRPIAIYTAARLAVFVVLASVLYLLGLRGLLLLALAVLLSMPVAYLLLGRQLAGVTSWLEQRRTGKADIRARLREPTASEHRGRASAEERSERGGEQKGHSDEPDSGD